MEIGFGGRFGQLFGGDVGAAVSSDAEQTSALDSISSVQLDDYIASAIVTDNETRAD